MTGSRWSTHQLVHHGQLQQQQTGQPQLQQTLLNSVHRQKQQQNTGNLSSQAKAAAEYFKL
jgi:hypothetical protein